MGRKIDITGRRFGMLAVTGFDCDYRYPNGAHTEKWLCKCDCGKIVSVLRKNLLSGNTTSCGCVRISKSIRRLTKHGGKGTKLYDVWCGIKDRCYNSNNRSFLYYGGRGISMDAKWKHNYENFKIWSELNGYKEGLTIDRIDVNGNYEPSNCRWVDRSTQANNRSNNITIEYNDEMHTCAEWAHIKGINYDTLNNRYNSGMSAEDILFCGKHKTGTKQQ